MTTLRELIKGSMRLINVIGTSEEPTADDMSVALESMDSLAQSMGNDILNVYTVQPYYFPLTPGKQHYTLGPAVDNGVVTGADWAITRPMRIEQARLLLYPSITFASEPNNGGGGGGGGGGTHCAAFLYEFSRDFYLRYEEPLNWPTSNLWYFRVFLNPVDENNLGEATVVEIDASVTLTIGDFKASVESQLPGFSVIINGRNLVLSRADATFALLDGNGAEWPNQGYDWGIWDYRAFYEYTDDNSAPETDFGVPLIPGVCYTENIVTTYEPRFVGYSSQLGVGQNVEVPSHRSGDLLVALFRANGTNPPPEPVGWTTLAVSNSTVVDPPPIVEYQLIDGICGANQVHRAGTAQEVANMCSLTGAIGTQGVNSWRVLRVGTIIPEANGARIQFDVLQGFDADSSQFFVNTFANMTVIDPPPVENIGNGWRVCSFRDAAGDLDILPASMADQIAVAVFRRADVGAVGSTPEALVSTSLPAPNLTLQGTFNRVLMGFMSNQGGFTFSDPLGITQLGSNADPALGGGLWDIKLTDGTNTSFSGRVSEITPPTGMYAASWAVELKGQPK